MEKTDFLDAGDESGLGGIVKMELINIYQTRAFVELFYKVKDFRYMALYRVFVVAILFLFTCMLRVKSTELMIQNMCVVVAAFIAPTWLIVHNCRIAAMRLCKKYKMENEFGKVNFLPDSVEINDFYVESRIVGYESISNYIVAQLSRQKSKIFIMN